MSMLGRISVLPFATEGRRVFLSLLVSLLLARLCLADGVNFPTRVVYLESDKHGVVVRTENKSRQNYLLQSRVLPYAGSGAVPFIVLPPLVRLNAGKSLSLQIQKSADGLPDNQESVFWLSVKLIPEQTRQAVGTMSMTLVSNYQLKLFYRPKAIAQKAAVAQALQQLAVRARGNTLVMKNPTPFYLTLSEIKRGEVAVKPDELMKMVPPFGEQRYQLEKPSESTTVTVKAFDEMGNSTPVRQLTVL